MIMSDSWKEYEAEGLIEKRSFLVSKDGLVEKEITNYEYDTDSRILYLPDYEKENVSVNRRVLVKYEVEVDCVRHSDSFTDGNFVSFQI